MDKVFIVIGAAIVGIAGIVFLGFLLSWPVMWLWNNALVGAVVGVNEVSWVQAWGISTLSGILFKTSVSTSK
jgi:hypothetical protein